MHRPCSINVFYDVTTSLFHRMIIYGHQSNYQHYSKNPIYICRSFNITRIMLPNILRFTKHFTIILRNILRLFYETLYNYFTKHFNHQNHFTNVVCFVDGVVSCSWIFIEIIQNFVGCDVWLLF